MRSLVAAFLLLGCLAAAILYVGRGSPPVPTIGPRVGTSKGLLRQVVDRDVSGQASDPSRDGEADLDAEFGPGDHPAAKSPPIPSTAQGSRTTDGQPFPPSVNRGSSDARGSSPVPRDDTTQTEQLEILRRSLDAISRREQSEAEAARGELSTMRQQAETAIKDRNDLSTRSSRTEADNTRLRASLQATNAELAEQQHRALEQSARAEKAERARQAVLVSENVSLQTRVQDAANRKQEAEARLGKAEASIKTLTSKLDDLGATSQRALTRVKEELVATGVAARTQGDTLAKVTQELQRAQEAGKALAASRAEADVKLAGLVAQRTLASASLAAARGAALLANQRMDAAQRAADRATERNKDLADRDGALRKQASDAAAQVAELKTAMARGATSYATLESRLKSSVSELSDARAENARLANETKNAALASAQKLTALGSQATTLTSEAAQVPDLNRKIERLEANVASEAKTRGDAEKALTALKAEDGRRLAEIDTLKGQIKEDEASLARTKLEPSAQASEGTRTKDLQAALASAQLQLAQAGRDRAAADEARLASESRAADRDTQLQAERKQAALLAGKVADAERDARRSTEAARQLADAQDKAKRLDAALASVKTELAKGKRETIAANDARQTSEKAAIDIDAKLQEERKQTAVLSGKVAKAENEAAQANATSKRSDIERDRATMLDAALASVRIELAQAIHDKAVAADARQTAEKVRSDTDATLQTERRQVALLGGKLAKAEHDAAEASMASGRLAVEQARARQLENALASARTQLTQANLDKAAASEARRSSEKAAAEDAGKAEQKRVALARGAERARRDAEQTADRISRFVIKRDAVNRKAESPPLPPSRPVDATSSSAVVARKTSPSSPRIPMRLAPSAGEEVASRSVPNVPSERSAGGLSKEALLPDGIPTHVVLLYAHDKEPAQARAQALRAQLESLKMDVTDKAGGSSSKIGEHVTYFYKEDSSAAKRVARQLEISAPVLSRNTRERFARPGTIEVSIGG